MVPGNLFDGVYVRSYHNSVYIEYMVPVFALYTEVYKDRALIFYLSYYHCLQTVEKIIL